MKILVAIDKFKGSLTSMEAAQAIRQGIESVCCCNTFEIVEIADGGDGSAGVLQSVKKDAECVKERATNPLGDNIVTSYLLYSESFSGREPNFSSAGVRSCVFIEMAKVSGLELVPEQQRNPLVTTTYGLGQLVKTAYRSGAGKITLSIGGSATNDGGTGMLQALGFRFYNRRGELVSDYMCGGLLGEIAKIAAPLQGSDEAEMVMKFIGGECELEVICDVTNPLLGDAGATYVYGPQKGASPAMLQRLEAGMENFVRVAGDAGCGADASDHLLPGAGAAGGVGYAVKHFLGGKIISGWRFFANLTNLKQKISEADLVISGEGRIDSQSLNGKVVDGVITLAQEAGKPVWLFCGLNSLDILARPAGIQGGPLPYRIFQLSDLEPDRARSMANAKELLKQLAYNVAKDKIKKI